ncbi:MAG: 4-hydroxythreonine-4-phosphate dehydrogenase PdxA [Verrucomicrobia bacterium]|jgi:4-hydroxythreonine-4-phosphate dehydrogenase|nr:4-hydroxythreonine-4-phosphate dehydrogenase PdxA [Verrucomicrobiota bacterium]
MTAPIGIALGDVTGIGPEITLKALAALADDPGARFLIIGDPGWLDRANRTVGVTLAPWAENAAARVTVLAAGPPLPDRLEPSAPEAARAAVAALREGAARCLRGELAALVTAPVSKEAIVRSGQPFVGQTEFLAELAGVPNPVMMLLGEDDRGRWLRVALVTTHVAIRDVAAQITRSRLECAIERAAAACRELGLCRARVAVCGLNPHAGEGGQFGTEEITTIAPAVHAARAGGLDVCGPLPADTLFYHALRGEYDAVVAMYHDQGLAPLKMLAFERGVNWTLGLPFIRTSPDHGTAYDIAGRDRANPSSMIAAIRLACQLAEKRIRAA